MLVLPCCVQAPLNGSYQLRVESLGQLVPGVNGLPMPKGSARKEEFSYESSDEEENRKTIEMIILSKF